MDLQRFLWFAAMGLGIGLTSQGLGYAIGSVFSITVNKNLLFGSLTVKNQIRLKLYRKWRPGHSRIMDELGENISLT